MPVCSAICKGGAEGRSRVRVRGSRYRGVGCRVQGLGSRVQGVGVQGVGCREQGAGFRVQGVGCRGVLQGIINVPGAVLRYQQEGKGSSPDTPTLSPHTPCTCPVTLHAGRPRPCTHACPPAPPTPPSHKHTHLAKCAHSVHPLARGAAILYGLDDEGQHLGHVGAEGGVGHHGKLADGAQNLGEEGARTRVACVCVCVCWGGAG